MLVTVYQDNWMTHVPADAIRTDPTRMAQGIMTGIGFLGAGVIFKEGLTVRGLTTAASIWVTAAIGILVGIGFYFAAALGGIATLAVLSLFRCIENRLPSEYLRASDRRLRARQGDERRRSCAEMIGGKGFNIANLSSRLTDARQDFRIPDDDQEPRPRWRPRRCRSICARLPEVIEFRISPTGD